VLRRWRRQPFEVAFEIGVIHLDEIAALKRIGASLDLRAEGVEFDADVLGRHLGIRNYQCIRSMVNAGAEASWQAVRRQEEVDCLCLPA
jgi:hypothetical protein